MPRDKTIAESIAEIKVKYSRHTLGFIEFFDGDNDGKLYACNLHRHLLIDEGYVASLSKMDLNAVKNGVPDPYGLVEIGDLDSGISDFHAFRVRIYPDAGHR